MYVLKDSMHVKRHKFFTKKGLIKYLRYNVQSIMHTSPREYAVYFVVRLGKVVYRHKIMIFPSFIVNHFKF